jgi:hypothetical protein
MSPNRSIGRVQAYPSQAKREFALHYNKRRISQEFVSMRNRVCGNQTAHRDLCKAALGACRRIQSVPMHMRSCFAAVILSLVACDACANVLISVYKNTQQMTVYVDGTPRYQFAVSTGRAGYGTPNGAYHPQHLERTWFSKEYYNSPMPHSIFFHGGYAIHGSYEINRLGGPASHGCIRLHPQNAAALFALVKQQGVGGTTIVVSGQNPAVARRHR